MIEAIKGYTGVDRPEGRIKMTLHCLYRCTVCGTIKMKLVELKKHECKKNENSTV
jgi:hypothetical protein